MGEDIYLVMIIALAALAMLAGMGTLISMEMLQEALKNRFTGNVLEKALELVDKAVSVEIA